MQRSASFEETPQLALVVGGARSGTTLLRLLLDAHPDIGCPAEAGLPSLMAHMRNVWDIVSPIAAPPSDRSDPGKLGPEAIDARVGSTEQLAQSEIDPSSVSIALPARVWIRKTVQVAMAEYCTGGQRIYVDKSLDSVYHLALVQHLFPNVRYILAFRHVMDTIASGIEASPWGFQAYGYAPYVQASPGNSVAALARYWLDHVEAALAWEERNPESCLRVRYEDLVADSESSVRSIQRFLGVQEDTRVLQRAFSQTPSRGPADYKAGHTSSVHTASVGHGKRVPVTMLPAALRQGLNSKLALLGYPELDDTWNTTERAVPAPIRSEWSRRLERLMGDADPVNLASHDAGTFAVLAEDHRALRWVVDTDSVTVTQGDGDVEAVLTGTTQDLVLLLTGAENAGTLLRSGRLRHIVANEDQVGGDDVRRRLFATVAALRAAVS